MASYYWVGGTGTWDTSSTANWSATSGGAAGAGPPLSTDAVIFNAASGSGTVTLGSNVSCTVCSASGAVNIVFVGAGNKLTVTGSNAGIFTASATTTSSDGLLVESTYSGSTGTRTFITNATGAANAFSFSVVAGSDTVNIYNFVKNLNFSGFSGTLQNIARTVYGNLTFSATMTTQAGAQLTIMGATSGPFTITSNGLLVDFPLHFNGVGGSWVLGDNLTLGASRQFRLINGSFDANGQNVTIGDFNSTAGTKTLVLGSGMWTVLGSAWNANISGLTIAASSGTINMTSASAKTFSGGGYTWPTVNQGGAGALTIQQSNTFANITNTVQPATVTLTAGTTQTVNAFSLAGTAGNLITLNTSSSGTKATLSDSSGVNSVSFASIKDINATGGAVWNAYSSSGNIDAGNNTGWDFNDLLFRYIYTRRKNKVIFPI